jgi:phytol kinase
MFSNAYGARVFASIVPLLNALRLYLAGTGGGSNTNNNNRSNNTELELASAISRSGDVRESLGGPFIYVMVLLSLTLLFWKDSAIGIVSLATMACGDGLADLIGRRYATVGLFCPRGSLLSAEKTHKQTFPPCSVVVSHQLCMPNIAVRRRP